MSAYPTSPRPDFLEWCRAHTSVFSTNAAQIGLTPAQATALSATTTAAAAALLAQREAQQAALVATQQVQAAFDSLRSSAGESVRLIRAFAESTAKPLTVYNLAQVPPPAAPAPAPPPAQPSDLSVRLDPPTGRLTLRWKASNPAGTSGTAYIIKRRVSGESEFSFIGVSGKKEFVDGTLIAGPDSVQYTVQGQRADSSGPLSPIFTVNFGQAPGGGMTASVTSGVSASTVDGQPVQKVLANGNGRATRARV